MTAEVNSAAAAGCPHHVAGATGKAQGEHGFSAHMRNMAHGTGPAAGPTQNNLSSQRAVSSIPKAESSETPAHQNGAADSQRWEYPSEEMYFKAMQRKGWDPESKDMKAIVAIHNTVNEQTWTEVLKWERAFHPSMETPKLKRFMGKPTDYSPKARMMNLLGWSVLPFDRHDWTIEREGKEVRYVIDFYSGQPEPGRPLAVYLDVRPALDSVENAVDRLRWQFKEHIQPLLPFRGAWFGRDDSSSSSEDASKSA